jgi:phosphoribosylformylglycinamidine synthase
VKLLVLEGQPALSSFRLDALFRAIDSRCAGLGAAGIDARHVFFLDLENELTADAFAKTRALLNAGTVIAAGVKEGFLVTPRKGTVSPWSSKATDIFHNCGLADVKRAERGIHFRLLDGAGRVLDLDASRPALGLLHDRMTEGVYADVSDLFQHPEPRPFETVDVRHGGIDALRRANREMGLALSEEEIAYLFAAYRKEDRDPSDVELMMFGQVNSEHCRHKIFNADWVIDGAAQDSSLFAMIRHTHKTHPGRTLSAYADNSAVMEGFLADWFRCDRAGTRQYGYEPEQLDILMKVETHNHPTAISPYPGAATGVGGEIRDEGATGIGGKPKAGLSAFFVSNLRIPGFEQPWEKEHAEFPSRLATPLQIMTEGPLGGAGFGNEFGRPQLTGIFRTFEDIFLNRYRGYHKPIMAAGGLGAILRPHVQKKSFATGVCILQLGGPALRIGLGGGAASSMDSGANALDLDFNSVQRDNAEMQRRCQEVIDGCIAMGEANPILSIHDIGAGGLSNGCPELVAPGGAVFNLRAVPNEERSMSPLEIWCCEAQERYVLAVAKESLAVFLGLCRRERCPGHVIGETTGDGRLVLADSHFNNRPIDMNLDVLLGKPPRMKRDVTHLCETFPAFDPAAITVPEAVSRLLRLPTIAAKTFLITIADRTITGLVARDQMCGPHQTPVADVAVTLASYHGYAGEAMSMGERSPVALLNPAASGRLAVGEALTNLAAAPVTALGDVKLSANWMCACGEPGEDAGLFDTVKAVGLELCPALGIAIPVGKDSLSMRTLWSTSDGQAKKMTAPLSLVVTAFAPVSDARKTLTPVLQNRLDTSLILVDLGRKRNRLGGSALAQVFNQVGQTPPDLDSPDDMLAFYAATRTMIHENLLLAYHDRSDGGLFVTLAEMAFASNLGLNVRLKHAGDNPLAVLFSEELGAVIQVTDEHLPRVTDIFREHKLCDCCSILGKPTDDKKITLNWGAQVLYQERVSVLKGLWAETSIRMQARRDNADAAQEEFNLIKDDTDPGLQAQPAFDPSAPFSITGMARPRMAIMREQGVNGEIEMAAAFDKAGFEAVDVHMTDLLGGGTDLKDFAGFTACGGFSYGDVLGAGSGWARSILFNPRLKEMFADFFARENSFALGVCNGCQMVSQLKEIIPGAAAWPRFLRNRSEQFEARLVSVEILKSPSLFLKGMAGSILPIPVAHGEGRVVFASADDQKSVEKQGLESIRFVDNRGRPTEQYPLNPNGSAAGMTGLTTPDGRVTILMPHPERAFRAVQLSYAPPAFAGREEGPWLRFFQNARKWIG